MKMDRDTVLEKVRREKKNEGRVRYTIPFDPKLLHSLAILVKNGKLMEESDGRLQEAFPHPFPEGRNLIFW